MPSPGSPDTEAPTQPSADGDLNAADRSSRPAIERAALLKLAEISVNNRSLWRRDELRELAQGIRLGSTASVRRALVIAGIWNELNYSRPAAKSGHEDCALNHVAPLDPNAKNVKDTLSFLGLNGATVRLGRNYEGNKHTVVIGDKKTDVVVRGKSELATTLTDAEQDVRTLEELASGKDVPLAPPASPTRVSAENHELATNPDLRINMPGNNPDGAANDLEKLTPEQLARWISLSLGLWPNTSIYSDDTPDDTGVEPPDIPHPIPQQQRRTDSAVHTGTIPTI